MTRDNVIAEARTWLGTKFRHQGHRKGVSVDCVGFVSEIGLAVGVLTPAAVAAERIISAGYSTVPSNGMLEAACERVLRRIDIDEAREGDIVVMRFATEPQHLGILMPYPHGGFALIHAYSQARKVVEHRIDDRWRERVTHAYAFPGLAT